MNNGTAYILLNAKTDGTGPDKVQTDYNFDVDRYPDYREARDYILKCSSKLVGAKALYPSRGRRIPNVLPHSPYILLLLLFKILYTR